MDPKVPRNMTLWSFLVYFLTSLFMLGWLLWPFLSIIVMAFVVTGVFNPVYLFFCRRLKPVLASTVTCFLIFILLFVPIVFFVGVLANEAYGLYLMGKSAAISDRISSLLEGSRVVERIMVILANFHIKTSGEELNMGFSELGKMVGLFLFEQSRTITSNVFAFVLNFFLMLLINFFLFIDGDKLVNFITDLSPLPRNQEDHLIQKFKDIAGAVLMGNGLGGIIQGVLGGIVFAVFGLKSPFLWGVIMGMLAFFPILGIGLVFIPAAAYLFLVDRFAVAIFFLFFYAALSFGIEYYFKPKLVGSRVKMHTLLVFFSIIGGLNLFGILGIIYGPLVVTAFLTLTSIYHTSYETLELQKRIAAGLPDEDPPEK